MNKLHLVWGEHTDFILKTFKNQRDSELHCNISIVSNDGYVVRGHQAILAAASGWFMQTLLAFKHDHPTIVLEDVSFHYLKALLNYIYVGSVQVDQTEMNKLLEIADSLQLKGLGRLKDNSAMSKFLSNSNNNPKDATDAARPTDDSCSKMSNVQIEKDSTSNTSACGGGILFEDTPDISEEEPVSDSEKQINTNDPSLNYSVETESNTPTVEERFFPCSSSIGDSILSSSQMHSDDSNNIHSSSFQGSSSVCFSQPAYVAKTHPIIHQSHFNQPSHLYNPCVPKREYEIRMSAPTRTSMLDYLNSNSGQQSSVGDFRIQNKMSKLPSQQELLYESSQADNNAVELQDSANSSQHCLNSIQHQLGSNGNQHHRHYTSQFLSSSPQVLPNYSGDCSSIAVSSSVLTMHQPGGYSYDYSVGNIATSSSQSDAIQQPNNLLPTTTSSLYQTAGIDLSLTKNEPASPSYSDDKRKRSLVNLEHQDGELLPDGDDSASHSDDKASKKSKLEQTLSSHRNNTENGEKFASEPKEKESKAKDPDDVLSFHQNNLKGQKECPKEKKLVAVTSSIKDEPVTNFVWRKTVIGHINKVENSTPTSDSSNKTGDLIPPSAFVQQTNGVVKMIRVNSGLGSFSVLPAMDDNNMIIPSGQIQHSGEMERLAQMSICDRETVVKKIVDDSLMKLVKHKTKIKGPRNMYILFSQSVRPQLAKDFPSESATQILTRVGDLWKSLSKEEKDIWARKAAEEKERHRTLYPDYQCSLNNSRQRHRVYKMAKKKCQFLAKD